MSMKITTGTVRFLTSEPDVDGPHLINRWAEMPGSPGVWVELPSTGMTLDMIGHEAEGLRALKDHIESQQS